MIAAFFPLCEDDAESAISNSQFLKLKPSHESKLLYQPNNAFSNFCDGDGEILKTVNTAVGATIAFENNSYDGNLLSDRYIECNGDVVAITNK